MYIFPYFFIFIFGICVGSFLNVLICRLGGRCQVPFQKVPDTIGGRSFCPKCGHQLAWQDLVPIFSFIWLRGRCRYCREPISWQYPIVELTTGILFLLIFNYQFLPFELTQGKIINQLFNFQLLNLITLLYLLFIVSCLIVIFVSDLKYFIIPDQIIWWGVGISFIYRLFGIFSFKIWDLFRISNFEFRIFKPFSLYLLSAIGACAFFLVIVLATKGKGMGLGDVKLAFLMGMILGWPKILPALLLAFVSGALVGLGLIAAGKAKMKSEIPFGVFLSVSTFLVMIFGGVIINRYFELLF